LPRGAYLPLNTSAFLFLFLDMPQLNLPPRLFPCLRFAVHLAMPNAKLGAKVDRYSFFVRLLPPPLHTGLARRTNIPITLNDPGQCIMKERPASEGPKPDEAPPPLRSGVRGGKNCRRT